MSIRATLVSRVLKLTNITVNPPPGLHIPNTLSPPLPRPPPPLSTPPSPLRAVSPPCQHNHQPSNITLAHLITTLVHPIKTRHPPNPRTPPINMVPSPSTRQQRWFRRGKRALRPRIWRSNDRLRRPRPQCPAEWIGTVGGEYACRTSDCRPWE
jgi:hypothetical protein